jgi:hypothetical protein
MYQPSVTPGRPQSLLVRYPPGVHPKGRHESVALWEDSDPGAGRLWSDGPFCLIHVCLVHAYLVHVGPSHHLTVFPTASRETDEIRRTHTSGKSAEQ